MLPADLNEFHRRARDDGGVYLEAAFGVVVLGLLAIIIWMAHRDILFANGVSTIDILWLAVVVVTGGVGLYRPVSRGIWPLVADYSFGSRIDIDRWELIWWHGARRIKMNRARMDNIQVVKRILDSETDELSLYDLQGHKISFDSRCVGDKSRWADALVATFPAIRLERQ